MPPPLIARLALDTREYEAGIRRVDNLTANFAKKNEKDIGNRIGRAFSFVALASGAAQAVRSMVDYTQELSRLGREHDITIADVQRLAHMAAEAGMSWDEYAQSIKDTGQTLKQFSQQSKGGSSLVDLTAGQVEGLNATAGFFDRIKRFVKTTAAGQIANKATFFGALFSKSFRERVDAASARDAIRGLPEGTDQGEAGSGESDFGRKLNAFELSSRRVGPNVNQLQQIGAGVVREEAVVQLKTAIQVLRQMDGTLKKISADQQSNIVLAP